MKSPLKVPLVLCMALMLPLGAAAAQDVASYRVRFTTEQLDNLVAPIALYPDPILAQVLIAATFPDQIDEAARFVRARGTRDIDDQPWDVSVRSVAHYAPVLNMMAERDDWTTALGQAYAEQSSDVMESVQHLRQMANAQGNLVSTPQQNVVVEREVIRIVPAQTRVIYVPTYDPYVVYYRPIFYAGVYRSGWSFGIGFPIGSWLMYDCDWYGRTIYYDDWTMGGSWRYNARPFIHVNFVYLQPRYRTVYVNRYVVDRHINYNTFNRYNTVHRTVVWNDRGRDGRYDGRDSRTVNRDGDRGRADRNDGYSAPRVGDASRVGDRDRVGTAGPTRDDNRTQGRDDNRTGRDDNRGQARDDNRVQGRDDNRTGRDDTRGTARDDNRGVTVPRTESRPTGRDDSRARGTNVPERTEPRTSAGTIMVPRNEPRAQPRTEPRSNPQSSGERRVGGSETRVAVPRGQGQISRPSQSQSRASAPSQSRASSPPSRSSGSRAAPQSSRSSGGSGKGNSGGSKGRKG